MGTHPIFESDFDCLTDRMGSNGSKGKAMDGGYPKQEGGGGDYHSQQFAPPPQQYAPPPEHFSPQVDDVTREHSACQKQFNPGDETYRCITCEATDDTPVLCRNCFEASEHKNHQWEMLRDEGGGWCDCGDQTAWKHPYVYCTFHAPSYNPPPGTVPPVQPGYPAGAPGYPPQGYPQQAPPPGAPMYPPQPGG